MPHPSILQDGPRFFPNVLLDQTFQRRGLLALTEGRLSWGVADPRRYTLFVWEKDRADFVESALALDKPLYTNAPFLLYPNERSKYLAYAGYQLEGFFRALGASLFPAKNVRGQLEKLRDIDRRMLQKYFQGDIVEGLIEGRRRGILDRRNPRPNASYFGRRAGRLFSDYAVARGDPSTDFPEVIGGLFQSVEEYRAMDNGTASQLGAWGLAPLTGVPDPQKIQLRDAGLEAALERYEHAARKPGEDHRPIAPGVPPTEGCTGLLISLFGGGSPALFANTLASVLVRSAARVDGNESILMGSYSTLFQGQYMPDHKRSYNRYGYVLEAL